jgi:hypothetical protein
LLLTLVVPVIHAQNFAIDWFTLDGGGGRSTGGVYAVSATVGQPDAGRMSGSNLTLEGGFWGVIAAIQTEDAPLLSVARTNQVVRVSWPLPASGWVLEHTNRVTGSPGPWPPVPFPYVTNATHIFIPVLPATGNRYYRLRKQ